MATRTALGRWSEALWSHPLLLTACSAMQSRWRRRGGIHQLDRAPHRIVAGVCVRPWLRAAAPDPSAAPRACFGAHVARYLRVLHAGFPPIGLALPIAVALFSVAEAGRLRVGIIVSTVLLTLSLYFQIAGGQDPRQLLGYQLPPVIALMGASLALGDGVRSRRLSENRSANGSARPCWTWSVALLSSEPRNGCDSPRPSRRAGPQSP